MGSPQFSTCSAEPSRTDAWASTELWGQRWRGWAGAAAAPGSLKGTRLSLGALCPTAGSGPCLCSPAPHPLQLDHCFLPCLEPSPTSTPSSPTWHCSPSMRTLKTSLRMVRVEPRTQMEKRKVLIGSAILYWGCKEQAS